MITLERPAEHTTPPALPEQDDAGSWHITCLRCTQASADSPNLSLALVAHTGHTCRAA